jgi:hypothetical protein
MALKVALGFDQLSNEMQGNFKTAAAYEANVATRMGQEYDLMCACAASAHIVDAFCRGMVWVGGAWRPCILMEVGGACVCVGGGNLGASRLGWGPDFGGLMGCK